MVSGLYIFKYFFCYIFSWKELLPKLLHLLVEKPNLECDGTQMSGQEFKCSVITSLCMVDWKSSIVDFAAMFM